MVIALSNGRFSNTRGRLLYSSNSMWSFSETWVRKAAAARLGPNFNVQNGAGCSSKSRSTQWLDLGCDIDSSAAPNTWPGYGEKSLSCWFALTRITGTVFSSSEIWSPVLFYWLLASIICISILRLESQAAQLQYSSLKALVSYISTIIGFLLGLYVSNSFSRWWALRMHFLHLWGSVNDLCMLAAAHVLEDCEVFVSSSSPPEYSRSSVLLQRQSNVAVDDEQHQQPQREVHQLQNSLQRNGQQPGVFTGRPVVFLPQQETATIAVEATENSLEVTVAKRDPYMETTEKEPKKATPHDAGGRECAAADDELVLSETVVTPADAASESAIRQKSKPQDRLFFKKNNVDKNCECSCLDAECGSQPLQQLQQYAGAVLAGYGCSDNNKNKNTGEDYPEREPLLSNSKQQTSSGVEGEVLGPEAAAVKHQVVVVENSLLPDIQQRPRLGEAESCVWVCDEEHQQQQRAPAEERKQAVLSILSKDNILRLILRLGMVAVHLTFDVAQRRSSDIFYLVDQGLLNAEEAQLLQQTYSPAQVAWVWLSQLGAQLAKRRRMLFAANATRKWHEICARGRGEAAACWAYVSTRLPYSYVHLLGILVHLNSFFLAILTGIGVAACISRLVIIWGFRSNRWTSFVADVADQKVAVPVDLSGECGRAEQLERAAVWNVMQVLLVQLMFMLLMPIFYHGMILLARIIGNPFDCRSLAIPRNLYIGTMAAECSSFFAAGRRGPSLSSAGFTFSDCLDSLSNEKGFPAKASSTSLAAFSTAAFPHACCDPPPTHNAVISGSVGPPAHY